MVSQHLREGRQQRHPGAKPEQRGDGDAAGAMPKHPLPLSAFPPSPVGIYGDSPPQAVPGAHPGAVPYQEGWGSEVSSKNYLDRGTQICVMTWKVEKPCPKHPLSQNPPHRPPCGRRSRPGAGWPRSAGTGSSRGGRSVPRRWRVPGCRHGGRRSSRRHCCPRGMVAAGGQDKLGWHQLLAPTLPQGFAGRSGGVTGAFPLLQRWVGVLRTWLLAPARERRVSAPENQLGQETGREEPGACGRSLAQPLTRPRQPPVPAKHPPPRAGPPPGVTRGPTCPGSAAAVCGGSRAPSGVSPSSPASSYEQPKGRISPCSPQGHCTSVKYP